jgi:lipid-binding SYLF domain-containing protein
MRLFPTVVLMIGMICLVPAPQRPAMADATTERAEIDNDANQALAHLYKTVPGSHGIADEAAGILIFPAIYKAGIGVGGKYGKGALRVHGRSIAYYSTTGASFGVQLGAEKRSMAIMFMTPEALQRFEQSNGWDVGADASVTMVEVGANGSIDASRLNKPVVAFIFGNTGLMGNLSLEGTKVSKLDLPSTPASGSTEPR